MGNPSQKDTEDWGTKLKELEAKNDHQEFRTLLLRCPPGLVSWLQTHQMRYPNFNQFVLALQINDPKLYHEWMQQRTRHQQQQTSQRKNIDIALPGPPKLHQRKPFPTGPAWTHAYQGLLQKQFTPLDIREALQQEDEMIEEADLDGSTQPHMQKQPFTIVSISRFSPRKS